MKAYIEYDPRRGEYGIHLFEHTRDGIFDFQFRPTPWSGGAVELCRDEAPLPESSRREAPAIWLQADVLDAIIEAHAGTQSADQVILDTLQDARSTRDRLLALVENAMSSK